MEPVYGGIIVFLGLFIHSHCLTNSIIDIRYQLRRIADALEAAGREGPEPE